MPKPSAVSVALQRASLRALGVVAPSAVDRLVLDRFATPARERAQSAEPIGAPWNVTSDGETLTAYTAGPAPRVLFVHGWEGRATDFAPLASAFRAAGFGAVAFDHPAHGRSSGSRATLPRMAAATLDVARAAGPVVAVVGHSLGATAGLFALSMGLAAQCAVLIAPPHDAHHFIRLAGQQMGLPSDRIAGAIALLEHRLGPVDGRETDRVAGGLRLPGLVLHDIEDRQVPFAHGAAVAKAWPGARLVPLKGIGHRKALVDVAVQRHIVSFVQESVI